MASRFSDQQQNTENDEEEGHGVKCGKEVLAACWEGDAQGLAGLFSL